MEINYLTSNTPCLQLLTLKKGASVLCTANIDIDNGICNGFIYIKFSNNEIMRKYLLEILYNFYKSYYFEDNKLGSLKISGPQCFSKFIHNNYCVKLYNYIYNNKWQDSLFINNNEEKKILIKISYNGYYNENNYVNTNHYGIMWKDKKIYNDLIINYNKINFIDGIVWINLDRSINRKNNMKNILKNINIPNYRISAIDGKNNNIQNLLQGINLARNMNNSEIGCVLSHIKAITFLSELNGNYFMVCEDDIEIRNINFIKDNLKDIINKCPEFDILILHKIYIDIINEEYINWNEHLNKLGKDYQIAGTSCYIISRSGINKIINLCKFIDTNNFIFNKSYLDVSDIFLYENTNTYVYKYNYISISGIESYIHEEHISHHNKCEEVQDKTMLNNCI
jgi:GR25 family glycosyltransferase involved in LPS biosynthesis